MILPLIVYAKSYKISEIPFDINIPDDWVVKTALQDKDFFLVIIFLKIRVLQQLKMMKYYYLHIFVNLLKKQL